MMRAFAWKPRWATVRLVNSGYCASGGTNYHWHRFGVTGPLASISGAHQHAHAEIGHEALPLCHPGPFTLTNRAFAYPLRSQVRTRVAPCVHPLELVGLGLVHQFEPPPPLTRYIGSESW